MHTLWEKAIRFQHLDYDPVQACCEYKQEAQLSQRDRALLGVIENFAKSHKVIQNDTRANPCVSYRFGDIQR